jgi:hypothetical protein
MIYQNQNEFPLTYAVWLAADGDYDLVPEPNVISATSLLRPTRSLVLSKRMMEEKEIDIDMIVASKLGTAVHASIEKVWGNSEWPDALRALGYPEKAIENIRVNPTKPLEGMTNVYVEQRNAKEIDGYVVSGKFDFVVDGVIHDLKTTKTYTWIAGSNDEDYRKQASIYRWLNQDIVTEDYFFIDYLFTDWSPLRFIADPKTYPKSRCLGKKYALYSIPETELFIRNKIAELKRYMNAPQSAMPECSRKELWMDPPKFAFYKDPNKTSRATKLFDIEQDAMVHNAQTGGKGLIVKRESQAKRCSFCECIQICEQAERLELEGALKR